MSTTVQSLDYRCLQLHMVNLWLATRFPYLAPMTLLCVSLGHFKTWLLKKEDFPRPSGCAMGRSYPLPVGRHCRAWDAAPQWTSGLEMGVCTCFLYPCLLVSHTWAACALCFLSSPSTLKENTWTRVAGPGTISWMLHMGRAYPHSSWDRTTVRGLGAPQEISKFTSSSK